MIIVTVTGDSGSYYSGTPVPTYQSVVGVSCSATYNASDTMSIGYLPSGVLFGYKSSEAEIMLYIDFLMKLGFEKYKTVFYDFGVSYVYRNDYYTVQISVLEDNVVTVAPYRTN